MVHGVRKGVARGVKCPGGKGMCFTSVRAAEAAVLRLKAERWYTCDLCGYMHITRYTLAEFNERKAMEGCTPEPEYGIVVPYTDEEGDLDEDQDRPAGAEPRTAACGPRAPTLERGTSPRPAPTPAEVAQRIAPRRYRGAVR